MPFGRNRLEAATPRRFSGGEALLRSRQGSKFSSFSAQYGTLRKIYQFFSRVEQTNGLVCKHGTGFGLWLVGPPLSGEPAAESAEVAPGGFVRETLQQGRLQPPHIVLLRLSCLHREFLCSEVQILLFDFAWERSTSARRNLRRWPQRLSLVGQEKPAH